MPIKNRLLEVRLSMSAQQKRVIEQREFAAMLGIAQPQYSRYERQERQPHIEVAMRIATKLGISLDDLFYEEPPGQ